MGNFKVRCVKEIENHSTKGRIYEIKDGILTLDSRLISGKFNNVDEVNAAHTSEFELVEDKTSFKVRCVEVKKSNDTLHTKDKVYEIKNGKMICDNGEELPKFRNLGSFEDLQRYSASKFELVEEKMFSKSDLKTGMRVERRDGIRLIVMISTEGDDCIVGDSGEWASLRNYSNGLASVIGDKADIVRVYGAYNIPCLLNINISGKLLYERSEPIKMTINEAQAELSKLKGKEVQIVRECE